MLVVENITKKFPGVLALDNVSLEIEAGKVTAIIGENGAGKSTLMKILSGVYEEFEGRILFKGQQVKFSNPKEAQDKGIAIIHQELNLIRHLSVAENIFLGRELVSQWGLLDKKQMRDKTSVLLKRLRLDIGPDQPVSGLKVGQQQVVEIAKALLVDSEVIIMDEPTSAISEDEVAVLFQIIRELRTAGKAIVYISHKLNELFEIADNYIVLRDGKLTETGDMREVQHDQLIKMMVGRDINILRKSGNESGREELLRVRGVSLKDRANLQRNLLNHISFSLDRGEIVGIFGLMGAGRTELLETIFGLHGDRSSGEIVISGKQLKCKNPAQAIKAGLSLVPEDRKNDGLVLEHDVSTNISITVLDQLERAGLLHHKKEELLVKNYVNSLRIKTPSGKQPAKHLSGGNQQKIVLAKWLATRPKVLMLDEPTRGIDINGKNEIYQLILKLAGEGLGILMASSELPEILAISDRVLVMADGNLTAEFSIDEATEDKILKAAIPKTRS